jgi:membrane protein CcdC involved in cytochrome C biogenesis
MEPKTLAPIIGGVVVLLVVGFRVMRMRGVRPYNPGASLILPALLAVLASTFFIFPWPYSPKNAAIAAGALLAGAIVGWWRGKLMHLTIAGPGKLNIQASPLAILVLVGLLVVRMALRFSILADHAPDSPFVLALDGAFIAFGVGLLGVARLEMFLRARKLLAASRQDPAAA